MSNDIKFYIDRIAFRKECLDGAREELQNWKPSASDYEEKIDQMIDRKYPIPETALADFDIQEFTVTQILRKLNEDALVKFREEFFQEHYDEITADDANELVSNIVNWAHELRLAVKDLDHFIQFGE